MTAPAGFDREKHEAQRAVGQFMDFAGICWCGDPERFLRFLLAQLERFGEDGRPGVEDRLLDEPLNLGIQGTAETGNRRGSGTSSREGSCRFNSYVRPACRFPPYLG